jgi:hypothetical protein
MIYKLDTMIASHMPNLRRHDHYLFRCMYFCFLLCQMLILAVPAFAMIAVFFSSNGSCRPTTAVETAFAQR